MNKVILEGRIGKAPEVRIFENGNSIATFSVATNEGYYNQDKQWVDRTEWHNIVVSGPAVEKVSKFPSGIEVLIEGKIRTREYDKPSGEKARITEIIAKSVKAFGLKKQESAITSSASNQQNNDFVPQDEADDLPF